MSDIRFWHHLFQAVFVPTIHPSRCVCVCVLGGQESTQLSRPLLLLLSSYENAVKARSSLKHLNMVRFKYL